MLSRDNVPEANPEFKKWVDDQYLHHLHLAQYMPYMQVWPQACPLSK